MCERCRQGLDHCHGTLLVHLMGEAECTGPGCADFDVARHVLVAECVDIDGDCACTVEVSVEVEHLGQVPLAS